MPEAPTGARVPAVLGLDLGTSEAKAALVGLDGTLLGLGRGAYPTDIDADGRAEQDPRDWWAAFGVAVRSLAPALAGAEVLAIACVGQGPTLVAADASGDPVRPAVTWQDRRSGNGGFGLLPRMAWLAEADPAGVGGARWLLGSWDAAGLWLSGEATTTLQAHEDPIDASALLAAGVAPAIVPEPMPFGRPLGRLRPAAAAAMGLQAGIPVVAGVNDGTASMLGAGLLAAGDAVDTGGTSGGLGIYADRPVEVPGPVRRSCPDPRALGRRRGDGGPRRLGRLAARPRAGRAMVQRRAPRAAAGSVAPGADGLVFLPYLAGERAPVFDDDARGAFFGLTLGHDARHLARAVLEGSAFAMRSVAEPLAAAGAPIRELRLTGRSPAGDTWARIKADVLGVPVAIPAIADTAALGAAIVAAAGVGAVPSLEAGVAAMTSVVRRLEPDPVTRGRLDASYAAYRALYPALRDA